MAGRRGAEGGGPAASAGAGAAGPGDATQPLAALPNLGPASARMLAAAGIVSVAQLRELGAVGAYLRVRHAGGRASLNLLWALEGALTGRPWQDVARRDGVGLRMALEDAERTGEAVAPTAADRRPPSGR